MAAYAKWGHQDVKAVTLPCLLLSNWANDPVVKDAKILDAYDVRRYWYQVGI